MKAHENGPGPMLFEAKSENPEAGLAEFNVEQAKRRSSREPVSEGG